MDGTPERRTGAQGVVGNKFARFLSRASRFKKSRFATPLICEDTASQHGSLSCRYADTWVCFAPALADARVGAFLHQGLCFALRNPSKPPVLFAYSRFRVYNSLSPTITMKLPKSTK